MPPAQIGPQWQPGNKVRWGDRLGAFRRDIGDGNAEVTIDSRTYRVRITDLSPG